MQQKRLSLAPLSHFLTNINEICLENVDVFKEAILCTFSESYFYLGVLVEEVYILSFSKNTLFFSYGALLQRPFSRGVLNAPFRLKSQTSRSLHMCIT